MADLERDLRDMMHRRAGDLRYTPSPTPGLIGRARVRRARTTLLAGVAVLALVVGGFAAARSLSSDQAIPPANPRPEGILADVGGWIAYGDQRGIWAMDPTQSGDPADRVRLSSTPGTPRAWSPDGSKLLILRQSGDAEKVGLGDLLFVLNADGTETRLAEAPAHAWITGGSFSRDGTEVVYAVTSDGIGERSAIFVVDAEGGGRLRTPRPAGGCSNTRCQALGFPSEFYAPTFSPDGNQIAYFEGGGDHSHSLRVMNADGSGDRELVFIPEGRSISNLIWSPDGSRLLISSPVVLVVGADGTGLTELIPEEFPIGGEFLATPGADPHWSPDGSRISYNWAAGFLAIVRWDGTQVQLFDHGRSGPWIQEIAQEWLTRFDSNP